MKEVAAQEKTHYFHKKTKCNLTSIQSKGKLVNEEESLKINLHNNDLDLHIWAAFSSLNINICKVKEFVVALFVGIIIYFERAAFQVLPKSLKTINTVMYWNLLE